MASSPYLVFCVGRPEADADDHKLGGLHGRDADDGDEPAVVDVGLRHRGAVTTHEVSFLGLRTFQGSTAPDGSQEVRNCAANASPERVGIWLEDHPLESDVD